MKLAFKIVLAVIIAVAYFFIVNILANSLLLIDDKVEPDEKYSFSYGSLIQLGVSDAVRVTVTRNRFYGKIIVQGDTEFIYIFNLIKVPKKVRGFNFCIFHIIFLSVILILFLLRIKKEKRQNSSNENIYKPFIPNYGYE